MATKSKIEWTETTWNPLRGCSKLSPGCKNCYAEAFAERFRGVPGHPYEFGFDLRLVPQKLLEPFQWGSQRTVFVNSMSDLFQDHVPDWYIVAVAKVMQQANWHTYQVLTKRSQRLQRMLHGKLEFAAACPHIWWGVSVEDRRYGIPRIGDLQESRCQVRFLSIEPLLEDLGPELNLSGIHWVIVGGESGRGARRMESAWVEPILQSCESHQVLFFFKQWGGVRKSRAGRILLGRTFDDMPARPVVAVPDTAIRRALASSIDIRQADQHLSVLAS